MNTRGLFGEAKGSAKWIARERRDVTLTLKGGGELEDLDVVDVTSVVGSLVDAGGGEGGRGKGKEAEGESRGEHYCWRVLLKRVSGSGTSVRGLRSCRRKGLAVC